MFGMANGGLFGKGFGEGRPQIVPYSDSDFIIASFGEQEVNSSEEIVGPRIHRGACDVCPAVRFGQHGAVPCG
ncbi:FtsW/RodA/SpoVE family cell cycle protein [Brevibacterium paucivorans]|uniref:Uncharacterized protein n=1 Tax=Brevibacterium paucivorans TaxID=170994 RepID=A0A2N6VII1_9MICO|nr:hypothetical protein CJ199_15075 [Brevibacterium paucivorans]